jgi:hypothetical protein
MADHLIDQQSPLVCYETRQREVRSQCVTRLLRDEFGGDGGRGELAHLVGARRSDHRLVAAGDVAQEVRISADARDKRM